MNLWTRIKFGFHYGKTNKKIHKEIQGVEFLCRSKTQICSKIYLFLAFLTHSSERLELFRMCHFRDILKTNLESHTIYI